MASIGTGWVDGAWVEAGWVTGAWSSVATAAVTGTASSGLTEAQVVAGGETIIVTLIGDTWVAAGATFNAQRQAIIDGLDSAAAEAAGWNAEVRDKEVVGAVVRTSDTVVTITLTAAAAYDVTADETITVTVPASALVTSVADVTAAPTFDVTAAAAESAVAPGAGSGAKQYAKRKYPRKVVIDGRAYTVQSAAEERELLRAYRDRLEADALRLALEESPKRAVAQAKVRVIRAQRRLEEVDDREDAWMRRLRDEDEELLIILH